VVGGNQRDVNRARAQARAAKAPQKTEKKENLTKLNMTTAEIMRQKQQAAEEKKQAEEAKRLEEVRKANEDRLAAQRAKSAAQSKPAGSVESKTPA